MVLNLARLMPAFSSGATIADFIQALGAILLYDGTLTTDMTPKMKNLGSVGAALDATISDVTVDTNGMNFNGTTSEINIPDNAAIQALATYTIISQFIAAGAGENNAGEILHLGTVASMHFRINSANLDFSMGFDTDGTDARANTAVSFLTTSVSTCLFGTYNDAGDRTPRIYKGLSGAVAEASYASIVTSIGTRVAPVGAVIGNFSDVRTWNGSIKFIAVVPRILTAAEMLQFTQLAGV